MKIEEITKRLSSKNIKILVQSLEYINQRLAIERVRAERAESRASALLTMNAILAGFAIIFIESFREGKIQSATVIILLFGGALLLLVKASFFCLKALWVLRGYELNAELPFELQSLKPVDSIREELAWKIWEYYELLPLSTQRLFWVNRAQRNLAWAILLFSFLAIVSFFGTQNDLTLNTTITVSLVILFTAWIILLDPIVERLGNLWKFE